METALIDNLREQPAFDRFTVAAGARLADGGRAVGVRLDPAFPLGPRPRRSPILFMAQSNQGSIRCAA